MSYAISASAFVIASEVSRHFLFTLLSSSALPMRAKQPMNIRYPGTLLHVAKAEALACAPFVLIRHRWRQKKAASLLKAPYCRADATQQTPTTMAAISNTCTRCAQQFVH